MLTSNKPIGIFDSGIGGLTVARAIVNQMPNESIIYFGDTAHLPYGDKSPQTVQNYSKKIVDFLLKLDVKLILIACNAASAASYEILKDYIGNKALFLNVIDPVVGFLGENYAYKRVGLIGTKLTIQSQVYQQKLSKLPHPVNLCSLATPIFVPLIEEGFFEHKIIDIAINEYLSHPSLYNIETLVLGCTHYPVIEKSIAKFYQNKINIIDSPKIVANQIYKELLARNLFADKNSSHKFYVSDYTQGFAKGAKMFFGQEINIEPLNIF